MLVNITQTFDFGPKRYYAGDNPDVAEDLGRRWIADGKATLDTDGVANGPAASASAVVGAADYATLVSTYPPASNAGKQAYTTNDSQFWNCNGTTWASASGGSSVGFTILSLASVTTSATPTAGAAVAFSAAACSGMIVRNGAIQIEYQRGGAGAFQTIFPYENKMILGITDASQIAFRRSDYATARNTQTSAIVAQLINTTKTFVCTNMQCTATSNSTYQAFASQACAAILLRNTSSKDGYYKLNAGATAALLRKGSSVLVTGITNANQVSVVTWNSSGSASLVVQGETFDSAPDLALALTTLNKAEHLSNSAIMVPEDVAGDWPVAGPFTAIATIPMFGPFTRFKKAARSISIFNTVANAVITGGTSADTALASDETYATWGPNTQFGSSTALTNTFTGTGTNNYLSNVNTPGAVDVSAGDIHVTIQRIGTGGTVTDVSVDLFSAGTPAAPSANYHTLSLFSDSNNGFASSNGFGARSFSASLFAAVGAGATLTAITYARIRVTGTAGLVVRPGEVAMVKKAANKGSVVITFDDNHSAPLVAGLAQMGPNNFPGVLFPSPSAKQTGTNGNPNGNIQIDNMLALQHKYGWQVAMQDWNREGSIDMTGNEWILEQQKNLLLGCALGFDIDGLRDGSYYGGYAYGITNEQYKAMQRIHSSSAMFYSGAGTLGDGVTPFAFCDTNPPGDPWLMRRLNMSTWGSGAGSANNIYLKFKAYVDQAIATKGLAVFASHGDLSASEILAAFVLLCAYMRTQVDAGNLQVVTYRELRRQSQLVV